MLTSVATVAPDLIRSNAYVDGRWVDADSGETFPVVNPATGETLAEVPRLGATETRRAIEAAERALPAWKARTAKERARILTRLATLMAAREDDLATLMVLSRASRSQRHARRSPTRSPSTSGSPSRRSGSTAP